MTTNKAHLIESTSQVGADTFQYINLHRTMINAAPDCVMLVDTNGVVLEMNTATKRILNLPESYNERHRWVDFVPPETQADCEAHFQEALTGKQVQFNIETTVGTETSFWDVFFSPVLDDGGKVIFVLAIGRDVSQTYSLDNALSQSLAREKLIAQEMKHRIKNLFSVVSVLITMAEREAREQDALGSIASILKAKVDALARASDTTYAAANNSVGVDELNDSKRHEIEPLLNAILLPYASMISMSGDTILIAQKDVTTLTLFLHELATNSAKYGALGHSSGKVDIHWERKGDLLVIEWKEFGGPTIDKPPEANGFGSTMMDRLVNISGGKIKRQWLTSGLQTELHLPY